MKTVALGVCNIHDSFRNKASIGLYKRKKMHCSEKQTAPALFETTSISETGIKRQHCV